MGFTAVNLQRPLQLSEAREGGAKVTATPRTVKSTTMRPKLESRSAAPSSTQFANPYIYPQQKSRTNPLMDFTNVKRWTPGEVQIDVGPDQGLATGSSSGSSGEQRSIPNVGAAPVVHPTEFEFRDPVRFLQSISELGDAHGIVKVIPPPSWTPLFALDAELFSFKTRRQVFNQPDEGRSLQKAFNEALIRFHDIQGTSTGSLRMPMVDKRPLNLYLLHRSVQLRGGFTEVSRRKLWAQIGRELGYAGRIMTSLSTSLRLSYQKLIFPFDQYLQQHGIDLTASPRVVKFGISEPGAPVKEREYALPNGITLTEDCTPTTGVPSNPLITNSHVVYNSEPDNGLGDGQVLETSDGLRYPSYSLRQFQQKTTRFEETYFKDQVSDVEREKEFWRVLSEPSECLEVEWGENIVSGSGFARNPTRPAKKWYNDPWNFNRLPFADGSLLRYVDTDVPDLTQTKLEVGMLFSSQSWHPTNFGSHAVSLAYFGSPRTWYSVPPAYAGKMRDLVGLSGNNSMISPDKLHGHEIPCWALDQRPGEMVVVFPGAFTAGFNHGLNLIETSQLLLGDQWLSKSYDLAAVYASARLESPFSLERLAERLVREAADLLPSLNDLLNKLLQDEIEVHETVAKTLASEVVSPQEAHEVRCINTNGMRYLSYIKCNKDGNLDPRHVATDQLDASSMVLVTVYEGAPGPYIEKLINAFDIMSKKADETVKVVASHLLDTPKYQKGDAAEARSSLNTPLPKELKPLKNLLARLLSHYSEWEGTMVETLSEGNQNPENAWEQFRAGFLCEITSPTIGRVLEAAVEKPQAFSLQMLQSIPELPKELDAFQSGLEAALTTRPVFWELTTEYNLVKSFVGILQWVRKVVQTPLEDYVAEPFGARKPAQAPMEGANIESLRKLLGEARTIGIPETLLVVSQLEKLVERGEQLSTHIDLVLRSLHPATPVEAFYHQLLELVKGTPLLMATKYQLRHLGQAIEVAKSMESPNIRDRPRYRYARGFTTPELPQISHALAECEVWRRHLQVDVQVMTVFIQAGSDPAASPHVLPHLPHPVALAHLKSLQDSLFRLKVVPDDLDAVLLMYGALHHAEIQGRIPDLRARGLY